MRKDNKKNKFREEIKEEVKMKRRDYQWYHIPEITRYYQGLPGKITRDYQR